MSRPDEFPENLTFLTEFILSCIFESPIAKVVLTEN